MASEFSVIFLTYFTCHLASLGPNSQTWAKVRLHFLIIRLSSVMCDVMVSVAEGLPQKLRAKVNSSPGETPKKKQKIMIVLKKTAHRINTQLVVFFFIKRPEGRVILRTPSDTRIKPFINSPNHMH